MGTEQSKVQLCTQEQYQKQKQKRMNYQQSTQQNQSFYKIQQCQYPHPLMQKNYKHNQTDSQNDQHYHRCTMKHSGYPDTYHLCSKCEQHPHKVRKNPKIFYQQSNYNINKPQPVKYDYRPTKYKEKDILAPGPQVPAFFNGFTLPLDRYYKSKATFTDYTEPPKGSPYREDSKSFEQSVYEQVSDKPHSIRYQGGIEIDGHRQNLKY